MPDFVRIYFSEFLKLEVRGVMSGFLDMSMLSLRFNSALNSLSLICSDILDFFVDPIGKKKKICIIQKLQAYCVDVSQEGKSKNTLIIGLVLSALCASRWTGGAEPF